ncbi:MAG: DNA-processing protein DprA [Saprospiraceae bacterium]
MSDKHLYEIALSLIPKIGPVMAKALLSYCGSAEAVFMSNRKSLLKIPGIGPTLVDTIQQSKALSQAEYELEKLHRHGIQTVFYTDPEYPQRLRQNMDCPMLLYCKTSDIHLLNANRILGIVGTRKPTDRGRAVCEAIVDGLLPYDVLVVSGLAFGIDICAHRRACLNGTPNFAVLAHGLGSIYPLQHKRTALQIAEHGGLISEHPISTEADPRFFPMRNRIISGMCDALLVVETQTAGGSMISAELADQYGREIFAVPGRIGDTQSAGCNLLIKTERAHLCESAADIASRMRWDEDLPVNHGVQSRLFSDLSEEEVKIVEAIRLAPEIQIDTLAYTTRIPSTRLNGLLLSLELQGLLRTLPGKRYRLQNGAL